MGERKKVRNWLLKGIRLSRRASPRASTTAIGTAINENLSVLLLASRKAEFLKIDKIL